MKCDRPIEIDRFSGTPGKPHSVLQDLDFVRPISTSCTFFYHKNLPRTIFITLYQLICPTLWEKVSRSSKVPTSPISPFRTKPRLSHPFPPPNDFAGLSLVPIQTPARYKINALYCIRSQHVAGKGIGISRSMHCGRVDKWWLWCPSNGLYVSGNVCGRGLAGRTC